MSSAGSSRGGLLGRASAWLRSPYFPAAAAALAVLFTLPALGVGWIIDDYFHRTILLERPAYRELLGPPSEMFRFFRGDPARTGRLMDLGLFPWWTDPEIKAEFLQALPVLTHRLDYALWPDAPMLMHAHNLFWLGTAAAVAAAYYRRMLGASWTAGAAALLFALDDARGATAGFLANRNVLIAATFGIGALICHDRWRRGGSRPSAPLATFLLLLALFSKEEGIGTCAYLGAYALFVDPAGRLRGLLALAPSVAAVAVWRMVRTSWGYGVRNMGYYTDPITDPGPFLAALPRRVPILLFGQWSPFWSDFTVVLRPPALTWFWLVAVAFLALLLFAVWPLLRRDRVARFWAAGMLFATVPVSATMPMDRLLTFVGLGASGLLARYLAFVLGGAEAPRRGVWRAVAVPLAWLLVAVHAVLAPLVLPFRAANPVGPMWVEERLYVRAPLPASLEDRTVVIVNAPSPAHAHYLVLRRELGGLPGPRHTRVLAPAMPAVTVRRVDARTLAIRPARGYLQGVLERIFRNERRPFAPGDRVRLSGMTATITALTADGRPAEVSFRFDVPLESPSLVWLCFRGDRFEPFAPPAVGEATEIRFDWRAVLSPPRR